MVVGVALAVRFAYVWAYGSEEIEYRGQHFKLSNKYLDYESFINDRNNLDRSELPRIEKMMSEANIDSEFPDWSAFVGEMFQIKFPGYGGGPGPKVESAEGQFLVETIEIPQVGKSRYFVLEQLDKGNLVLVDDFVASDKPPIRRINFSGKKFVYIDQDSKTVRTRDIGAQPARKVE